MTRVTINQELRFYKICNWKFHHPGNRGYSIIECVMICNHLRSKSAISEILIKRKQCLFLNGAIHLEDTHYADRFCNSFFKNDLPSSWMLACSIGRYIVNGTFIQLNLRISTVRSLELKATQAGKFFFSHFSFIFQIVHVLLIKHVKQSFRLGVNFYYSCVCQVWVWFINFHP